MKIIRWIIIVIFFLEGITKVLGIDFQENAFANWGYPIWFMYAVGIFELAGVIGMYKEAWRKTANINLLVLMAGAFYTHISRNDPPQMMGLAVLTTILLIVHLWKMRTKDSPMPQALN